MSWFIAPVSTILVKNLQSDFPQEHLVELSGLSPHYVGRITIYQDRLKYNIEVDIIQSESGKIYSHVKSRFGEEDVKDSLAGAVQDLKNFLDSKRK